MALEGTPTLSNSGERGTVNKIFAKNLTELVSGFGNIAYASRELGIHRTQMARFLSGDSTPRPDVLRRICEYFDLDARILVSSLGQVRGMRSGLVLPFVPHALKPASHDLLQDGFYREWRKLTAEDLKYSCHLLRIQTVNGQRKTKTMLRESVVLPDGRIKPISNLRTHTGSAFQQPGGCCIIDSPTNACDLTFTTLRTDHHGDRGYFPGYKNSVANLIKNTRVTMSATLLQYVVGGFKEAMAERRRPIFRSKDETPAFVQWMLEELLESNDAE